MKRILAIILALCGAAWAQQAELIPIMTSNTTSQTGTSGVASASSEFGSTPTWNAMCDNVNVGGCATNGWLTNSTSTGWICYQFATAQVITRYGITPWSVDNFPTRSPKTWTFEGSNTSCTASTTVLDTQTNFTSWVASTPAFFSFTNTTAYTYYRINVSLNGGNAFLGVMKVYMFGKFTGQLFSPNFNPPQNDTGPAPFGAFADSEATGAAYHAFGWGVSTNGFWGGASLAGIWWLVIDTDRAVSGFSHILGKYSIQNVTTADVSAPQSWIIQGSNDANTCSNSGGTTWSSALDTRTGQTSWGSGEVRTFTLSCVSATSYRCYRINVSANQSTANTVIGEWALYEGTAGAGCPASSYPAIY